MVNAHKEKDDVDADTESHQSIGATKRRGMLFLYCLGGGSTGGGRANNGGESQLYTQSISWKNTHSNFNFESSVVAGYIEFL